MNEIHGALKASPWLLSFGGIMYTVVSGDAVGIVFTAGMVVFAQMFNQLLKRATHSVFGTSNAIFTRPAPPPDGCGSFARLPSEVARRPVTYGMPSGHAQQMAFAMGFWVMYFMKRADTMRDWQRYVGMAFFVALWGAVAYHRVHLGCHNVEQVLVGSVVGVITGVVYMEVVSRFVLPRLAA